MSSMLGGEATHLVSNLLETPCLQRPPPRWGSLRRDEYIGSSPSKLQIGWRPPAYASIVSGAQLRRRVDGPTLRLLIVDVALAGIAVYAACLLTAEILAASSSEASAAAAYTTAALYGATVAIRRLAPRAAVAVLLTTAGIYALALDLPVFMLGPAVLFVAYAVGSRLSRQPAMITLGVIELALVVLLAIGPSFPGWGCPSLKVLSERPLSARVSARPLAENGWNQSPAAHVLGLWSKSV